MGSIPTRSRLVSPGRALRCLVLLPAVALLGRAPPLGAQEPAGAPADTVPAAADSVGAVVTRAANFAGAAPGPQDMTPPVSPMGAFFRSLVVPGWGQAAVDQPGRGAFYFAGGTFTLFMAIKSQAELDAARRATPADSELVDSKKGQRETWIVLAIFVSLFSAVDAWVSAHLWDFEGEITPPDDGSPGIQLQYSVPVGGP